MRIFSFLSMLGLLCYGCKKSNSTPDLNTAIKSVKTVKSMIITYPFINAPDYLRELHYTFQSDTNNRSYTVFLVDSSKGSSNNLYRDLKTTKTYYFSFGLPKRVTRITCRQFFKGEDDPASIRDYANHDIDFEYNDYTYFPSHITLTNYTDFAGNVIKNQISNDVSTYSNTLNAYTLDILSCKFAQQTRSPFRGARWGNFNLQQYNDSSFEVNEAGPFYYNIFFNYPAYFPDNNNVSFKEIFKYNDSIPCSTYAIDITDNAYETVYGQRKFDFSYDGGQIDLDGLFSQIYGSHSLMWEKVVDQMTGLERYRQESVAYHDVDPYLPDLYSYYQDICSSYTDSLFTADGSGIKHLVAASRYSNAVERDADGDIISITRKNDSDSVFRKIQLFY